MLAVSATLPASAAAASLPAPGAVHLPPPWSACVPCPSPAVAPSGATPMARSAAKPARWREPRAQASSATATSALRPSPPMASRACCFRCTLTRKPCARSSGRSCSSTRSALHRYSRSGSWPFPKPTFKTLCTKPPPPPTISSPPPSPATASSSTASRPPPSPSSLTASTCAGLPRQRTSQYRVHCSYSLSAASTSAKVLATSWKLCTCCPISIST